MNALKSLTRSLMTLGMIAGLFAAVLMPAAQANAASRGAYITLHVFECSGKTGDLYGDCHDWKNNALDGAAFKVAGVVRYTSGGYVSWKPGAGYHTVRGYNFGWGYYESYVYCSNQVTGAVLYDGPSGGDDAVSFTTTVGQEVICDWYYLY